MKETIAKWIIEFLLRQTINDKIINGVLSCLPLSNDDNRLKKTILLRNVELEVSNGVVSEKLLEFLEIIEELDHREGRKASILMKGAYCAVAVDCTVKFLDDKMEDNEKYLEKVEEIWKNRVCKVKGLKSEELKCWLEGIEAATMDSSVCERICARNTRNEALKSVKAYVKEAWKCMGPTFLEVVDLKGADEVLEFCRGRGGGGLVGDLENSGRNLVCRRGGSNHCSGGDGGGMVVDSENLGCNLGSTQGIENNQASVGRKHASAKPRVIRPTRVIGRPRGAIISDPEESLNIANDDPTSVKDKVQERHESDSVRLHTGVNESHHLDASQADHNLSSTKAKESTSDVDAVKNTTVPEANESRSNVDEAKNTTVPVIHEVNRTQEALESCSGELHADVTDPLPGGPNLPFTKAKDNTHNMDAAKKKTVPVRHATPEVNKVQEALRTSSRELREAVTDPLPEALKVAAALSCKGETRNQETAVANETEAVIHEIPRVDSVQPATEPTMSTKVHAAAQNPCSDASQPAQNVSSKMVTDNTSNDPALANQTQDVPRDSTDKNIEYMDKTDEHDGNVQGNGAHDTKKEQPKRKRSLMEPNGTGRTSEWEDSIDNSSTSSAEGPRLRSASTRSRSSPLRVYAEAKKRRRGKNWWTSDEEEALMEGIRRFGVGRWSEILHSTDIFKRRTPKDLRDKYRNLTKR